MEFCKAFNAQTKGVEPGLPIPVVITVYADRSFTFITKTPPAAVLLRKAAGVEKGSGEPNIEIGDKLAELVVIFPTNVWEYDVLDYFPFATPKAKAIVEQAKRGGSAQPSEE